MSSKIVKKKFDYDNIYQKVLLLVKEGNTIEKACKLAGISHGWIYEILTPQQKKELISERRINARHTTKLFGNNTYVELDDFFRNEI